ncbi:hypothetical protein A8F94_09145 [Bacillus sp. FJAT-27225]|nr:hypothetical protein A8F94_09145 [Bacillus sp. FJAT-27225]
MLYLYRYNSAYIPIHFLLWCSMALGYYMSTGKNDWLVNALMGSFILNAIGSIPMLIQYFKKRQQIRFIEVLLTFAIFLIPYWIIAVLMRIFLF